MTSVNLFKSNYIQKNHKNITFKGDISVLKDYYSYGLTNKQDIFTYNSYLTRNDLFEDKVYETITDLTNNKPSLITGDSGAGKSVLALKMIQRLKAEGHKVLMFENINFEDWTYFSNTDVNNIKKQLSELKPDERLYVFIDEPQFIVPMIREKLKIEDVLPSENPLYGLYKLVKKYHNLKLIGVMYTDGFDYDTDQSMQLLKYLFSKENRIVVPNMLSEDKKTIINSILSIAGFEKIPEYVDPYVDMCMERYNVREFIEGLYHTITKFNGDKDILEPIKYSNWYILFSLLIDNAFPPMMIPPKKVKSKRKGQL